MSEELDRVTEIAEDLFLLVLAGLCDDRSAVDRSFEELRGDSLKIFNYLSTSPLLPANRGMYADLWGQCDAVKLLLFRKARDFEKLDELAYDVRFNMHRTVPLLDQDAAKYLNEVFGGEYRFNAGEVGYLWRLIHDMEFPIMPKTHTLKHDVVANIASNGGVYEDFVDALDLLNVGERR